MNPKMRASIWRAHVRHRASAAEPLNPRCVALTMFDHDDATTKDIMMTVPQAVDLIGSRNDAVAVAIQRADVAAALSSTETGVMTPELSSIGSGTETSACSMTLPMLSED